MVFLHSFVISNHERVLSNLLAHELGHQWWGNKVPINMLDDDWNQWLSEGFATYSDALYTEHSEGAEAFADHIDKLADLYLQQTERVREDPISQTFMDQSPLYRPVVYEKGALVLHALRYVVGDEAFFEILRQYAAEYAFEPSTVGDFRRLASEAAGENLDWFFSEWLDRPGCPEFEIASVRVGEPDAQGRRTVEVEIVQPGALSRMPMDVRAIGPAGQSETVRAELGRKENTVTIETDFEIEAVVLDPDHWVLQRSGPDQRRWSGAAGD
jgi:aminopeptidase N